MGFYLTQLLEKVSGAGIFMSRTKLQRKLTVKFFSHFS